MTHTDKQITDLIAEARDYWPALSRVPGSRDLFDRLADALEAEHQRAREWDKIERLAHQRLLAERDALRAQFDEIRALHYETDNTLYTVPAKVCAHRYCVNAAGDQVAWPCPTGRILSRAIDTKEES